MYHRSDLPQPLEKEHPVRMKISLQQLNRTLPWDALPDLAEWVIQQGIHIQHIPAPTFGEAERARYVMSQFAALDLTEVDMDAQLNVYGVLRGSKKGTGILLMAHTDTVFPIETDLSIRKHTTDFLSAPGIGDNSIAVAGLLGILHYLRAHQLTPDCDLWFVATSCEEGLGDLKGIRAVWQRLEKHIGAVINVEGMALGHVYHAGIAVQRLRIQFTTEGGHSWLHYGRPSAIHTMLRVGAALTELLPPAIPRTTFNIGIVEGGQSINSIASDASLWLDMRSETQQDLENLASAVHAILKRTCPPDVHMRIEVVGNRPAGTLDTKHVLVQGALQALNEVGMEGSLETGSTDGNIPLHYGYPCVTVGITRGGNAHRLDEYIELAPIARGMQHIILLILATAHYQSLGKIPGIA